MAAKEGKVTTLKDAKEGLNEEGQLYASQVAAKRSRAIRLQHARKDIRLRQRRDFRGGYILFRQNLEDWKEGHEQSRLLNLSPDA